MCTTRARQNALGRFGWTANNPTLGSDAGAYNGTWDTSSIPGESARSARVCEPNGIEVDNETVGDGLLQSELASPPRTSTIRVERESISSTLRLRRLPNFTDPSTVTLQVCRVSPIHSPVHDLWCTTWAGSGRQCPDFQASGQSGALAAWGVGLIQTVNGHTNFLLTDGPGR